MSSGRACVRTAIVVPPGRAPPRSSSADEVEVRLGRRREPDLDLGDAEGEQQREEPPLARAVHRVDERLVAVAKVGRAPDRGRVEDAVGPGSIGQIDGRVRSVLPVRHGHRAALLESTLGAPGVRTERICRRKLPLAGKEEREADQRAASGERCATRAGHGGHDNRPFGGAARSACAPTGCRRRANRLSSPARVGCRNSRDRSRSREPQGRDFRLRPPQLVGTHPPAPPD